MNLNLRLRINIQNTFLHNFRLIPANGLSRSYDLAVQIRQTHFIIINQIQRAHTTSCQRLTYITTHTANTKDCNPGSFKPLHRLFSQQ